MATLQGLQNRTECVISVEQDSFKYIMKRINKARTVREWWKSQRCDPKGISLLVVWYKYKGISYTRRLEGG